MDGKLHPCGGSFSVIIQGADVLAEREQRIYELTMFLGDHRLSSACNTNDLGDKNAHFMPYYARFLRRAHQ